MASKGLFELSPLKRALEASPLFQYRPHRRPQMRCMSSNIPKSVQASATTPLVEINEIPDVLLSMGSPARDAARQSARPRASSQLSVRPPSYSPRYDPNRAPQVPSSKQKRESISPSSINTSLSSSEPTSFPVPAPEQTRAQAQNILSPDLLAALPHLTSQPPFYATIHIHGKSYLVTAGDVVRLPFLMHGVTPGDILRLDRVSIIGSRDWTLRAGGIMQETITPLPQGTGEVIGKTDGLGELPSGTGAGVMHTRPKKENRPGYLDDRLYVIRAVVTGTESEPMRTKIKKKQRQRRAKKVESKLRYTILKIREISVKSVEELTKSEGKESSDNDISAGSIA